MQIPILQGIYAETTGVDFRSSYPRNKVPVPKAQGISEQGYLRPAEGIAAHGSGPGPTRGGIQWQGALYRVMGTKFCRVSSAGVVTVLGDVGNGGPVSFDYSFNRLAIASGGALYYWDGSFLTTVTDPDLGTVLDVMWIAGYFMTTDGENIVVTELLDPTAVNPLRYGSSEADPDPVLAVRKVRNEAYAVNRYTIEGFQNIGGSGFPFARIDGAQVQKGAVGTHAVCHFADTLAFVGSAKNEPPGVYLMGPGTAEPISTREIETVLRGHTEQQLSQCVVEARQDRNHQLLMVHLPDQTLVYDAAASRTLQTRIWFTLDSGGADRSLYRARHHVWVYDGWHVGDPASGALGRLTDETADHYGQRVGWEFGVQLLYNEGRGAQIHELELACLSGRAAPGADPVVWTSYSHDGNRWSDEKSVRTGRAGEIQRRLCWRQQGSIRQWRTQRFRGFSDSRLTVARLNADIEPLFDKGARG